MVENYGTVPAQKMWVMSGSLVVSRDVMHAKWPGKCRVCVEPSDITEE
jgi:hypothetical protein